MNVVHVVVPSSIDDPTRPSGGNTYDRRVCDGLVAAGWSVHEHALPGRWPRPDVAARTALTEALAAVPDGASVLLDGLIASAAPDELLPQTGRLRPVVLVHLPLGASQSGTTEVRRRERAVLSGVLAVITTSVWTKDWLLATYGLPPDRIHVVEPGVDIAEPVPGTVTGGQLLCVAAVTPAKGHDVLVAALAGVSDLAWQCVCVGALDLDPGFAEHLRNTAQGSGIGDRVRFVGTCTGADLTARYAAADLLVLASRAETYGMVVTEALARGLPVVAAGVGGVPDALGRGAGVGRPGMLVPSEDPAALAVALRRWLVDGELRKRLRHVALERRATLADWAVTAERVAGVLTQVVERRVGVR